MGARLKGCVWSESKSRTFWGSRSMERGGRAAARVRGGVSRRSTQECSGIGYALQGTGVVDRDFTHLEICRTHKGKK